MFNLVPSLFNPDSRSLRPAARFPRRLAALALGGCLALSAARAQDLTRVQNLLLDGAGGGKDAPASSLPRTDKSQYNLFHPVPDDLLRPFSSSRPDQTTGPHSVDAGHFYLETGVSYGLDLGATRTDTWTAFQSTHIRIGLTTDVELEIIYDGLDNTRTLTARGAGLSRKDGTIDGSAALTLRTRLVFLGNDDEKFAFAIDPEIILPTVSHHVASEYVQGDAIFTMSIKLPAGFSTTINATPGVVRNANDTAYDFGFTSGVTLYHNLFRKQDRVQLYLEYYDTLVTGPGSTDARQADIGVRWRPLPNLQFDAGCNFGVSVDATDYQPFTGIVARF